LRYSDPTGHRQCEDAGDGACLSEKQVTKKWKFERQKRKRRGEFLSQLRELRESGAGGPACSGPNQSIMCQSASEPELEIPIDLSLQYRQLESSGFSYGFDALASGLKVEMMAFDLVLAMQSAADYAKPVYRQLKAVLPLTALEMSISSSLQSIQDIDNNLKFGQRFFRSLVVGVETGATDVIADGYGAAGFTVAGPLGYGVASYAASMTMDNNWDNFNAAIFPRWGLGTYP
jgi:hypothetical protein